MRTGLMDPAGRPQTEQGRTSAVAGLVLGLLFGALAAGFLWTRL